MAVQINPLAGQPALASMLIEVDKLVSAYHTDVPDPTIAAQRVAFGTSGHRGSAFDRSFNEWHVLAVTQAICHYRKAHGIGGPLYLGIDTHALSAPACATALEVLAANNVDVMLAVNDEFAPTPAISHAILTHNRGRGQGHADGIVVTPSHNPPRDGGFKYNPPHGGPAGQEITDWIEAEANRLLEAHLEGVRRVPYAMALRAATTHRHDFLNVYVADLGNVIDMDVIREAKVRMGVDPLGGAGVHYWGAIAERYRLDLTVISEVVDPTFAFMPYLLTSHAWRQDHNGFSHQNPGFIEHVASKKADVVLPALSLTSLEGQTVTLAEFKRKPIVLNLWATWCPPCVREMPVLHQAQIDRPDVNLVFLNQREPADTVSAWLQARKLPMRSVLIDGDRQAGAASKQRALSTTLFFDAKERLVSTRIGELSAATLNERLQGLTP